MNIETGNTATQTGRRLGKLIPNPKAKLQDQFHEVARFKYLAKRTEDTYWQWIKGFILFHQKRHPGSGTNSHVPRRSEGSEGEKASV